MKKKTNKKKIFVVVVVVCTTNVLTSNNQISQRIRSDKKVKLCSWIVFERINRIAVSTLNRNMCYLWMAYLYVSWRVHLLSGIRRLRLIITLFQYAQGNLESFPFNELNVSRYGMNVCLPGRIHKWMYVYKSAHGHIVSLCAFVCWMCVWPYGWACSCLSVCVCVCVLSIRCVSALTKTAVLWFCFGGEWDTAKTQRITNID